MDCVDYGPVRLARGALIKRLLNYAKLKNLLPTRMRVGQQVLYLLV